MRSTISLSLWLLFCATLGCATLLDEIEHCELDCSSDAVEGFGNCEPKCSKGVKIPSHIEKEGQDSIKKYLDNFFSNSLFGVDSTEESLQTHPTDPPHTNINIPFKLLGENNIDVDEKSYKLPKKSEKEKLLDENIEVKLGVEVVVGDGEYVVKIKKNPSSSNGNEIERVKQMAQNGAMLVLYGDILHDMGEKLLQQSQESLYKVFKMPPPPKSKSHDDN